MDTAIYPMEIRRMFLGNPTQAIVSEMLHRLSYTALGLAGEAGEFANKIKKLFRDNEGSLDEDNRVELALELGGALWYVAANAKELGYTLSEIAEMNRVQLASRKNSGTIHGSGDNR